MTKLAPSLLSADFARLGEDIRFIESCGAVYAHIDVMDGHFVDNISMGIPVIKSIRSVSRLVFDVHLMISDPAKYVKKFAEAGADIICFHLEAAPNPMDIIADIRALGKRSALAINPGTPVEELLPFVSEIDMALVMSVHPGAGGQVFIPEVLPKIKTLRQHIDKYGLACDIEIDGGINTDTVLQALDAGANVIVAGSNIFGAQDPAARIAEYIKIFQGA